MMSSYDGPGLDAVQEQSALSDVNSRTQVSQQMSAISSLTVSGSNNPTFFGPVTGPVNINYYGSYSSTEKSGESGYESIRLDDLDYGQELSSRSSQNKVYKGTWSSPAGPQTVALKHCMHFKEEEPRILAKLKHENIIIFLGVCKLNFPPDGYVIVTEYAGNGSLYDLICKHRNLCTWEEYKEKRWIQLAKDGAEALKFIHEEGYQHGDVKSPNFVITSDETLKLCDFGTARQCSRTVSTYAVRGSWPWMAPEVMGNPHDSEKKPKVTTKADVYSFAVVIWELWTGEEPFSGQSFVQIHETVATKEERPKLPSDCPQFLRDLLAKCWLTDHKQRPSMARLLGQLDQLLPEGTGSGIGELELDEDSNSGGSRNPQEARRQAMQHIQSLVHACQCRDANCRLPNCQKMKRVVQHTKVCKRKTHGECPICKQLIALCCYHAKLCKKQKCLVPFCLNIRHKLQLQHRLQQAQLLR